MNCMSIILYWTCVCFVCEPTPLACLLMSIMGVVLYGSLVMLPIMLQTLLGYTALQAGVVMFPRGLGSFIAMPIVGAIMTRFDPRRLLVIGIIACAASLFFLGRLSLNLGFWN